MASLFVLGGSRSGKSRHAVAVQPAAGRVAFVATAQPGDGDMALRIARHRAERPPTWTTIEEPLELTDRLRALPRTFDAVVVDCITLWVANRMLTGESDKATLVAADELAQLVPACPWDITIVSNEVGEGVHPPTEAGLRYRDLLGMVNQRLAAACTRVVLMVAGVPMTVKGGPDPHVPPVQTS